MLKKTIKYMNFDDVEVTEDFHFNLTKAELLELELQHDGGLEGFARRISNSTDNMEIYNEFKQLLLVSVGKRKGSAFIKNDDVRSEFASSEAYSEFLMELLNNTDVAVAFFNGIMPVAVREEIAKQNNGQVQMDYNTKPDPEPEGPKTRFATQEDWEFARREFLHTNAGAEMPPYLKEFTPEVVELTREAAQMIDPSDLRRKLESGEARIIN